MHTIFSHLPMLLKMSAQGAILIVLVLAAQWIFGGRLQPRWRHVLWLLVMLRLALPWTIPAPFGLLNFSMNFSKLPAAAPSAQPQPEASSAPIMDTPIPKAAGAATVSPADGHSLAWAWVAGFVFLMGCGGASHYKFLRRVARQHPLIHEPTLRLLEECKAQMGVRMPVALIETEAMESPTLFGFVRPRVLLPPGFASGFTNDELRHVFLHELAHIKRNDVLIGWLMLGLQAVHWFNPLVWLAFNRMRTDRELACDALALSRTRAGENESYGLTIVKLLEKFGQTVQAPSLAGILENKQQMKERICMIAKFHKTERGLALAVVLLAGLALATFTEAQSGGNSGRQNQGNDNWGVSPLQQKTAAAQAGDQWAAFQLWDAYYHGKHGLQPDATEAEKWLDQVVQNAWVVRFEPVDDFAPQTPGEFMARISKYAHDYSGQTNIGAASFFRTTKQGDKLVAAFLSNYPDRLSNDLSNVPGVKVTSVEQITPEEFIKYEESPQETFVDIAHPDVARGVWVVRFEPVGDFAPQNPGEYLAKIHVYSGQNGMIGYFRTTKAGDKLVGSFLAYDPDQLKAALGAIPEIKITSVEKLTQEQFDEYQKLPQQTLEQMPAPQVVATTPPVGATDVDPALTEITVTFDQDMGSGMSWTGSGPDFPPGQEGQRAFWRDKRTCVLPVKLEAGHYYRVGINSKSYRNFASDHSVAALPSTIYFTTQGASRKLKARTLEPQVVRFDPPNGARDVSTTVTELRVTFNVPMGGGCSWCTVGDSDSDFPKGAAGKNVYWTKNKKTCVLPVDLKPGMTYRLSLNAPGYNNFQSDAGVPLEPVTYTFTTSVTP